jgi:inosine/xanthosine triphosphate pyrophosphatase family protein
MTNLTFVTGNSGKLDLARTVLSDYGIQVDQQEIDVPEIQSQSVREVAGFSARHAAD